MAIGEAKARLRIDGNDEDADINRLIASAAQLYEADTDLALIKRTVTQTMDDWPRNGEPIEILPAPLAAVASVKYYDQSDVLQTFSSSKYTVDTARGRGLIWLNKDETWPTLYDKPSAITISATCGYSDSPLGVPEIHKAAILLLVGHWYANREAVITGTIASEVPIAYDRIVSANRVPSWV